MVAQVTRVLQMSFSLSSHAVIDLLKRFDDPRMESYLVQLEPQTGFFLILLGILTSENDLENNVKLCAMIHFKNAIEKYWRKTSDNILPLEEKQMIRQELVRLIGYPIKQIAIQHGLALAKIARLDYPSEWPTLFQQLIDRIECIQQDQRQEAENPKKFSMVALHQVIKALASRTMPSSRKSFQDVSTHLMEYLSNMFKHYQNAFFMETKSFLQNNCTLPPIDTSKMHLHLVSLKVTLQMMQRVLIYGVNDFEVQNVSDSIDGIFQLLNHLMLIRRHMKELKGQIETETDKLILRIGKVFLGLIHSKLIEFMLLPQFVNIMQYYWQMIESMKPFEMKDDEMMKRVLIQGLSLFKYLNKHPNVCLSANSRAPKSLKAYCLKEALYTTEFVSMFFEHLILHYLLLTKEDVLFWEEDGESFVNEEEEDHWEYHLRGCAEKIVMELVSNYKTVLVPVLLNRMQTVEKGSLTEEAVLNAFGICAQDLYDHVDYDAWLLQQWLPRLSALQRESESELMNKVLMRRSCLLIGQWISVKSAKESRPSIYAFLLYAMSSETKDVVVRLTSLMTLSKCLDDWDFEPRDFNTTCIAQSLFAIQDLMAKVENDYKMKLIHCLSIMIERMRWRMGDYLRLVLEWIPFLWTSSQNHHLFQSSLLVLLSNLVSVVTVPDVSLCTGNVSMDEVAEIDPDSLMVQPEDSSLMPIPNSSIDPSTNPIHLFVPLQTLILPILKHCLDPKEASHVYLYEDALDLWLSVIEFTTELSAEWLNLFVFALDWLQLGTENMRIVLKIVEAYILVDVIHVLSVFAVPLFQRMQSLLQDASPQAMQCILGSVDLILSCCQERNAVHQLISVMKETGMWKFLCDGILIREERTKEECNVKIREGTREGTREGRREGMREGTREGMREGTREGIRQGSYQQMKYACVMARLCGYDASLFLSMAKELDGPLVYAFLSLFECATREKEQRDLAVAVLRLFCIKSPHVFSVDQVFGSFVPLEQSVVVMVSVCYEESKPVPVFFEAAGEDDEMMGRVAGPLRKAHEDIVYAHPTKFTRWFKSQLLNAFPVFEHEALWTEMRRHVDRTICASFVDLMKE